jgi:hypothetical protein
MVTLLDGVRGGRLHMGATLLLAISLPLLFINPVAGIVCFIIGGVIATIEDKESASIKRKNKIIYDADKDYRALRNTEPLSQDTFRARDKLRTAMQQSSGNEHNEYLLRQLQSFERKFHEDGFIIETMRNGFHVKLQRNTNYELETLFSSPQKYSDICKHLNRLPVPEIINDWEKSIFRANEMKLSEEVKRKELERIAPEIISIIRKNIAELARNDSAYRTIVETVNHRFRYLRTHGFSLRCENGEWSVSILNYAEKFRVIPETSLHLEAMVYNDAEGRNGLFYCNSGDEVRALVACGLDVNSRDRLGNMPIHINESAQAVEALLDCGAEIDALNNMGSTALERAMLFKNTQKSALLVSRGARGSEKFQAHPATSQCESDPLRRDADGRNGLFFCNTASEVRALVARGLDVNERDRLGNTPLHINEIPEAVRALLECGAMTDAKNNIGSTPLARAKAFKNLQKIALLVSHGAEVN